MSEGRPIAVLEPAPRMMIAVQPEEGGGRDKVYLHGGGQGFWVARMAAELGALPRLCAPVGGRSGALLPELMRLDGVEVVPVPCHRSSAVWISTGRDGEPATVGETNPPPLDRHEVDGLYSATLAAGLAAGIAVLTGPPRSVLPVDVYRRLAADLSANGARVVADVAMEALEPALAGGIDVLKVSDEDLLQTGWLRHRSLDAVLEAVADLRARGARAVVVSRAADPVVVGGGGEALEVVPPTLEELNWRGAGDAMTGALAAGLARGMPLRDAVPLAVAAGTLNVTRRGLGTGQRRAIEELAKVVRCRRLDPVAAGRDPGGA